MNILDFSDYKLAIRARVDQLKSEGEAITLKRLASYIGVQYTYLSKVLSDKGGELNEDHLFLICQILKWSEREYDFLCLLRSASLAESPGRIEYINAKMATLKNQSDLQMKIEEGEKQKFDVEMKYLTNPRAVLAHVALHLPRVQKNSLLLCDSLNLSISELKELLGLLAENGFIELLDDGLGIKKMKQSKIHFAPTHPLMRVHQNLLKTALLSRLGITREGDKKSFLATFNIDSIGRAEIEKEFEKFLSKTKEIVKKRPNKNLYQISFDLIKWF